MSKLHIFNPETDYARASGMDYYNLPKRIRELRQAMALTPLRIAERGDAILLLDPLPEPLHIGESEVLKQAASRGVRIVTLSELRDLWESNDAPSEIEPWGWDSPLRKLLLSHCTPSSLLPSPEMLANLRLLSHRRTTIPFLHTINEYLKESGRADLSSPLPCEFTDAARSMQWLEDNPVAFFKAPWSSSGRGILFTADSLLGNAEQRNLKIQQWIAGIIRRQGSVMGEVAFEKLADFASEWQLREDGQPEFIGFSFFETSASGKFHGCMRGSQNEIRNKILEFVDEANLRLVVEAQRIALCNLPYPYTGILGIDMLATTSGKIHPCIEINFRQTMGSLEILAQQRAAHRRSYLPGEKES